MINKRSVAISAGVVSIGFLLLVVVDSWPVSDNDIIGTYQFRSVSFPPDYIHLLANSKYVHTANNHTTVGKWKVQRVSGQTSVILEGDTLNVNGNEYYVRNWFGRIDKLNPGGDLYWDKIK